MPPPLSVPIKPDWVICGEQGWENFGKRRRIEALKPRGSQTERPFPSVLRIPMKWGTDSGEVGQRRSEAALVTAMISEVPHLSQGFCDW